MNALFNGGILPEPQKEAIEELLKSIHEPYDPFSCWEDWRLWMLSVRSKTLAITKAAPTYAPVITKMLASSVMGLALHDLQKKHTAQGGEIRAYTKTHPLLSSEEVPKEGIAYIDNWGFVHWQRQKRLIALIQLHEYLTQPDSDWLPPEIKQVNFPSAWREYIDSFDPGFRLSLWGPTDHWGRTDHTQATANLQEQPQASPSPKQLIGDICRAPLSQADFSELLGRLGVIDSKCNCLVNHLQGPARSKKGAFTAAYRVLHWAQLLEPISSGQLGDILHNTYGVEMGADLLSRELTAKGRAPDNAPLEFKRAVDTCKEWLEEWETRLKANNDAP